MHLVLKLGDRLVLMSGRIAEVTDANGELYGFERACSRADGEVSCGGGGRCAGRRSGR
jgi:hypothetical protein